jgi:hypothetical protein
VKITKLMIKLWKLAGEIGAESEVDPRYAEVYKHLSYALDAAEQVGLITYSEEK